MSLGPTRKLRVTHWDGRPPKPGEWLAVQGPRARSAFKVLAWRKTRPGDAIVAVVTVERHGKGMLDDLPDGTFVHPWQWDKRKRRQPFRSPLLD